MLAIFNTLVQLFCLIYKNELVYIQAYFREKWLNLELEVLYVVKVLSQGSYQIICSRLHLENIVFIILSRTKAMEMKRGKRLRSFKPLECTKSFLGTAAVRGQPFQAE